MYGAVKIAPTNNIPPKISSFSILKFRPKYFMFIYLFLQIYYNIIYLLITEIGVTMKEECFLVASGSGSLYAKQIGALFEINQEFNIKSKTGTSGGGLACTLFSLGFSDSRIHSIIRSLDIAKLLDPYNNPLSLIDNKTFALYEGRKLQAKFNEITEGATFKDLPTDLNLVSTNVLTGSTFTFSKVNTPDVKVSLAMRATMSLPFIFKPVPFEGMLLVDGGVTENFHLKAYENRQDTKVIGLEINPPENFSVNNIINFAYSIIGSMQKSNTEKNYEDVKSNSSILKMYSDKATLDFSKVDTQYMRSLIEEGREEAGEFIKRIRSNFKG